MWHLLHSFTDLVGLTDLLINLCVFTLLISGNPKKVKKDERKKKVCLCAVTRYKSLVLGGGTIKEMIFIGLNVIIAYHMKHLNTQALLVHWACATSCCSDTMPKLWRQVLIMDSVSSRKDMHDLKTVSCWMNVYLCEQSILLPQTYNSPFAVIPECWCAYYFQEEIHWVFMIHHFFLNICSPQRDLYWYLLSCTPLLLFKLSFSMSRYLFCLSFAHN